jgi:hypothetical protein
MRRPLRDFRAESFELEGRLLLASVPTSPPVATAPVLTTNLVDHNPIGTTSGPVEPTILASYATLPPMIVAAQGTPHGIVLTFSKPMNSVGASNLNNYAVHWTSGHSKVDDLGPFALLLPWGSSETYSTSSGLVRLKSAQYDPATQSVTLITRRKLTHAASSNLIVTQGQPAKTSGRPQHQSNPGPGLTDLEGNPINADSNPGKFQISVGTLIQQLSPAPNQESATTTVPRP